MAIAALLFLALAAGAEETVLRRLEDKVPGAAVIVEIVAAGAEQTTLNGYTVLSGKRYRVYTHPGSGERQEFDELSSGRLAPFFKGGEKALLYRSTNSLGSSTLYVVRYQKPRFRRVGTFPEGRARDLDGDGRFEVTTKRRPLGRFFPLGCDGFGSMADGAWKTEVHAWNGTAFVPDSGKYASFFKSLVEKDEKAVAALEPEKIKRTGEYMGAALTLYLDFESAGRGREGWGRLQALLKPLGAMPGGGACLKEIDASLRDSLKIPSDW